MQQCWVKITKPQGHLEKNDLANQKSWLMWRCHAENGEWWDELHLPMVVRDLTATPEMQPLLYVFLSIGQCSKEAKTQHAVKIVLLDCLWRKQLPSQVPGVCI